MISSVEKLLRNSRAGTKALIAARQQLEQLQKISQLIDTHGSADSYKARIGHKTEAAERIMLDTIDSTYDTIITVMGLLSTLPPDERLVMTDYYIIGYSWDDIARRRHYSERTVFNLRDRAIKRLKGEK